MSLKLGFMSYGELTSLINKARDNFSEEVEFFIVDTPLENVVEMSIELKNKNNIDVFVSAGGNAHLMKEAQISPFVEITPTTADFLFSLKETLKHDGDSAIITYQEKMSYISEIKELIKVPFYERTYENVYELDTILNELRNLGVKNIIGSSLVREKAIKKGFRSFMLYSRVGVNLAIDKAINIAQITREKFKENERLKAMMDYTYEGIIATNKEGIVEIYNRSAERITGISANSAVGRRITDVLETTRLDKVLLNEKEELNQSQLIGDAEVITNRVPIKIEDELIGAIATFQTMDIIQKIEEKIRILKKHGFKADVKFADIIGESDVIRRTREKAKLYSKGDSTILIQGESGTGKDLFAQSIHNNSPRLDRPFVAVNCAALPENILESELFGYEEGAFTGARKGGKKGLFELAHTGTLFLDEIGEVSLPIQARLLRVLENREVLRIGGQSMIPINIRVIAATNKNLWDLVEQGTFREDLYYRICVLELEIPPLRERKEDIPLLTKKFFHENRKDLSDKELSRISENPLLIANDWNGNIRELKNIIERLSILYTPRANINELIKEVLITNNKGARRKGNASYFKDILDECSGNKSEAARRLGISRTTLWRKLNE